MKREEVQPAVGIRVTLAGEGSSEVEEKKSVFLGHAMPVESEEEALTYIQKIKKQYADARHNVWAYRMQGDMVVRCSDDGEPQGSAGIPVLDAIRKSGVSNAVVVVTRYFGGILLGAGGLVRMYSRAAKLALDDAKIVTLEKITELLVDCSYSDYQRYLAELPRLGAVPGNADFSEKVAMRFSVPSRLCDALIARFREISGGQDVPTVVGERFGNL